MTINTDKNARESLFGRGLEVVVTVTRFTHSILRPRLHDDGFVCLQYDRCKIECGAHISDTENEKGTENDRIGKK